MALFCKEIPVQKTGKEIFNVNASTFEKEKLKWNNCLSVCSDGRDSITAKHKEL